MSTSTSSLQFLGVGGAFAPLNIGNSIMLITSATGKRMLFDCGSSLQYTLKEDFGLTPNDIDAMWISHAHADHIGSMEWFAFYRHFVSSFKQKTTLYVDDRFVHELWNNSLKGGLSTVNGSTVDLNTYFHVKPTREFQFEEFACKSIRVPHMNANFEQSYTYGLYIENIDKSFRTYITGDTQFCPYQLNNIYRLADQIFHDTETLPQRSYVHANIEDLKTLPENIKAKIWMYHYREEVDAPGFAGFVKKGQIFDI